MDEAIHGDKRLERVKQKLKQELVDSHGNPADPEQIAEAVESAAAPLADAPVQEFTPLLIEHQVRDALRQHGFHRDLGDQAEASHGPRDTSDERRGTGDKPGAVHLSGHEGVATPEHG